MNPSSLLLISALFLIGFCKLGLDLPTPDLLTAATAKCLLENHYETLYIRAYRSYGKIDPNVLTNIRIARAAGFKDIDVYIFPCVSCGNPKQQVKDALANLKGIEYGMVWLDVEEYQWTKNLTYNREIVTAMLNEVVAQGRKVGVYTNWREWGLTVGKDWDGASAYPLWFPYWDHTASFKGFKEFGGWKKPYAKQYEAEGKICGLTGLDLDYKP